MKILVDMNLSPNWIGHLSAAGLSAVHWSTVGPDDASDADIMAFARREGAIVMTQDLDFSAILAATNGNKPSVIQIRGTYTGPDAIGSRVIATLFQYEVDLAQGAIITLDAGRARVRVLPLRASTP